MEFQDLFFLLFFLAFSFLPKKKKLETAEEIPEPNTEVIRKRIEALKKKRNSSISLETSSTSKIDINEPFDVSYKNNSKKVFYDKQPLQSYITPVLNPQEVVQQATFNKTKEFSTKKCKSKPLQKGMKWHIILSKPICMQTFHGNFTNR